jgi:hypothetical protein
MHCYKEMQILKKCSSYSMFSHYHVIEGFNNKNMKSCLLHASNKVSNNSFSTKMTMYINTFKRLLVFTSNSLGVFGLY